MSLTHDSVAQWEAAGQEGVEAKQEFPSIEEGCAKFILDAEARCLKEGTLYKYRLLFRQLQTFTRNKGTLFVSFASRGAIATWQLAGNSKTYGPFFASPTTADG